MDRLLFSFIKRYLIVPLSMAIVVIIALSFVLPKLVETSQNSFVIQTFDVDASSYNLKDYTEFKQLKRDNYVATITSDEIKVKCAVVYDKTEDVDSAASLYSKSVEPWNKGSVAIVGENRANEFRYLHNANIGTEIKIDYYKNSICTYEITKATYNKTIEDIPKALKENDLVLCVPYLNFENGEKLYTFYFAKLGGVQKWK